METDLNFWLQLFTVAFCIGLGGRYGGGGPKPLRSSRLLSVPSS